MLRARDTLIENEVMPRRYFSPSLNTLPYLCKEINYPCPVSESISQRVLALPMSHELELLDIKRIAKIVMKAA